MREIPALAEALMPIVARAGTAIMRIYDQGFTVQRKATIQAPPRNGTLPPDKRYWRLRAATSPGSTATACATTPAPA
jgi:hypothetical protein